MYTAIGSMRQPSGLQLFILNVKVLLRKEGGALAMDRPQVKTLLPPRMSLLSWHLQCTNFK